MCTFHSIHLSETTGTSKSRARLFETSRFGMNYYLMFLTITNVKNLEMLQSHVALYLDNQLRIYHKTAVLIEVLKLSPMSQWQHLAEFTQTVYKCVNVHHQFVQLRSILELIPSPVEMSRKIRVSGGIAPRRLCIPWRSTRLIHRRILNFRYLESAWISLSSYNFWSQPATS